MKVVNVLFFMSLLLMPTSGLRGQRVLPKGKKGLKSKAKKQQAKKSMSTRKEVSTIMFSGWAPGLQTCFNTNGLCEGFVELALALAANDVEIEEGYAVAAASFLCDVAASAIAESFSFFNGGLHLEVETTRNDDIRSVRLFFGMESASLAYAFASTEAMSTAATETQAYAYVNSTEFCQWMSLEHTQEELQLVGLACPDFFGGISVENVASANTLSSSLSSALTSTTLGHFVNVQGKDIEHFEAAGISGASNFVAAQSTSFAHVFAQAWTDAVAAAASNNTVCQDWYEAYCSFALSRHGNETETCLEDDVTVCSNLALFAATHNHAFAELFAMAASQAVAQTELTFGYHVDISSGNGQEESPSTQINLAVLGDDYRDQVPQLGVVASCIEST